MLCGLEGERTFTQKKKKLPCCLSFHPPVNWRCLWLISPSSDRDKRAQVVNGKQFSNEEGRDRITSLNALPRFTQPVRGCANSLSSALFCSNKHAASVVTDPFPVNDFNHCFRSHTYLLDQTECLYYVLYKTQNIVVP